MLVGELRGKVGVAPSTTTLTLGQEMFVCNGLGADAAPTTLSYEEYLAKDIDMRKKSLALSRRMEIWRGIGTFAQASLAGLALLAGVAAWIHTGRIEAAARR